MQALRRSRATGAAASGAVSGRPMILTRRRMEFSMSKFSEKVTQDFLNRLQTQFNVSPDEASDKQIYLALSAVVTELMKTKRQKFMNHVNSTGEKQIFYLSMEFLMGRSLKTSLYNLDLAEDVEKFLKKFDIKLDRIYDYEPDAGLGNGGLGRLAACYLDGLATTGYPATGHSICYEYGIFRQKLEDGWQTELPDNWLPGGEVWLDPKPEQSIEVHFEGDLEEYWDQQYHHVSHVNYSTVTAIPYDMYVSGYNSNAVSVLRLWSAKAPSFDMAMFNQGDYSRALAQNSIANAISKVLYPNDNHVEGKSLRLRQQYFLCAAAVGDIVNNHMAVYGTLDNLADKVAIHINDTHPTLAIPELMRILLDDCGYTWEKAWDITTRVFAYTNHTVMAEALEKWDVNLVRRVIPRIFSIIVEINNRYCAELFAHTQNSELTTQMSIIKDNMIHMATLCVAASHSVNGVSKLHSEIIKESVFHNEFRAAPQKFTNVTNGIAYRRWLYQSNPGLTALLKDTIGSGFMKNAADLEKLRAFQDDAKVLKKLMAVKRANKAEFAKYVKSRNGIILNPDSVFDVQVKRLHEYKRQHLNALNILADYQMLLDNPDMDFAPKTYIFAAKAAPGYYLAKQIIKMIWCISEESRRNPKISEKLAVVFLENYCVTLSEMLMPASDFSEQISLAGTEASGTGNMKLMLNGAVTLGTFDGANVEIVEEAGRENNYIFGATVEELEKIKDSYDPVKIYNKNALLRRALDTLVDGTFPDDDGRLKELHDAILKGASWHKPDHYYVMKDFGDYYETKLQAIRDAKADETAFARKCLMNVACSGKFSSDRTIRQYAKEIWSV